VEYVFEIDPVPKGRPRFTRQGRAYTPQRTKIFESELSDLMREQSSCVESGSLKVEIIFYLRKPKTVKRKYPTVKPDLDNFIKGFCDAGNGILWEDDAQIVTMTASKQYADSGRIYLKITRIK
jgi:Holliday junction resolvase RusA-like endonuclease